MKAFVFTKCAKVTLKKCKNAKIVNLYITRTQNGIAPCFIQFSQNLTCDCLLIFVFSPENLKLFCSDVQNSLLALWENDQILHYFLYIVRHIVTKINELQGRMNKFQSF